MELELTGGWIVIFSPPPLGPTWPPRPSPNLRSPSLRSRALALLPGVLPPIVVGLRIGSTRRFFSSLSLHRRSHTLPASPSDSPTFLPLPCIVLYQHRHALPILPVPASSSPCPLEQRAAWSLAGIPLPCSLEQRAASRRRAPYRRRRRELRPAMEARRRRELGAGGGKGGRWEREARSGGREGGSGREAGGGAAEGKETNHFFNYSATPHLDSYLSFMKL